MYFLSVIRIIRLFDYSIEALRALGQLIGVLLYLKTREKAEEAKSIILNLRHFKIVNSDSDCAI